MVADKKWAQKLGASVKIRRTIAALFFLLGGTGVLLYTSIYNEFASNFQCIQWKSLAAPSEERVSLAATTRGVQGEGLLNSPLEVGELSTGGSPAPALAQVAAVPYRVKDVGLRQRKSAGSAASAPAAPLPLCTDGMASGRWVGYSEWAADTCAYHQWTPGEVERCLEGKWVHFFGDSTVRQLARQFSLSFLKNFTTENNTIVKEHDLLVEMVPPPHRVTYLFRGKAFRQRHPREGATPEDDIHNSFLESLNSTYRPDYMVMTVGDHELIGWTRRPTPDFSLEEFAGDVEDLFRLLAEKFTGQLLWFAQHALMPGRLTGESWFRARAMHDQMQELLMRKAADAGAWLMDFHATTVGRPDCVDHNGVHYHSQALILHANITANTICNRHLSSSPKALSPEPQATQIPKPEG